MFGYLETSRACDTFLNFIRLREVSFFEIKRDFLDSLEKERGQVYVGIENGKSIILKNHAHLYCNLCGIICYEELGLTKICCCELKINHCGQYEVDNID